MSLKFARISAFSALTAFLVLGCGSSRPPEEAIDPDKEDLIEVLTLFVEAVQADRFEKAFSYLTPAERSRMQEAGGEASQDIKRRLKALRLSTLAQRPSVRLQHGKVEGIYDQMPSLGPLPESGKEGAQAPRRGEEVPSFQ